MRFFHRISRIPDEQTDDTDHQEIAASVFIILLNALTHTMNWFVYHICRVTLLLIQGNLKSLRVLVHFHAQRNFSIILHLLETRQPHANTPAHAHRTLSYPHTHPIHSIDIFIGNIFSLCTCSLLIGESAQKQGTTPDRFTNLDELYRNQLSYSRPLSPSSDDCHRRHWIQNIHIQMQWETKQNQNQNWSHLHLKEMLLRSVSLCKMDTNSIFHKQSLASIPKKNWKINLGANAKPKNKIRI